MSRPWKRSTRRLLFLLLSLPMMVIGLGVLYMIGMDVLEHTPRTFWQSIEWASETLTTTGYGHDAKWTHPLMNTLVIFTQFFGMFLVVLFFPVYALPYMEEQFESRLKRALPPMGGKVLIQGYGPAVDALVVELGRVGIPLVILEEDDTVARGVRDRGYDVVAGNLEEQADLLKGVENARALVTNADDHTGATFIMIAREMGYKGQILALAEDPLHRAPMETIGANAVFTPSHVLAAALAAHASTLMNPRQEGLHLMGNHVGLTEFRVQSRSPLAGQRLGALHMRERHGVTVIGQWISGQFVLAAGPDTELRAGAIVVAVGAHANLAKVERLATPLRREGPIVIAGFGAVGSKVAQMLGDAGEKTVVINSRDLPGVDVVGNVLEQSTLEQARVREAKAVVLALSNDSAGVFAAAVVRDYAEDVPLIARVNRAPNVARLYAAGADFALSVGQVAGQILAHHLLAEDRFSVEQHLRFSRLPCGRALGKHPWRDELGQRDGASIVAVERGGEVYVEFDDAFRIREGDVLFMCGTTASLDQFRTTHGK